MTSPDALAAERAHEIIDHLPVTVYRTTPEGRILEGNPAVQGLLGYTMEEFTSLYTDDLYFDPEDRGPFMQKRIEGTDVVRTVLRLKRKDGSAVWAEDVGRAVKDADGNVLYFDGTLVDITDQVEAERALRANEAMLRTIHDNAPIAIFNLDPSGKVFQANPQAHRMLGLDDGELLGKTIAEFTFPDDASESQDAFRQLKEGDTDEVALDKRYRRVDGKAIWGHVRAVAVRHADGSFSHTISLVQDITRRKRTEDAFRLLDGLTRQVNEAGDLDEALSAVLRGICDSIGFAYGEAWLPDDEMILHLSPAWSGDGDAETDRGLLKFRHLSQKLTFDAGTGLPGITMEANDALWFENISHGTTNLRAGPAAAAGLKCALGVPVRSGDRLVAVLLFLDGGREAPKAHTLRLVKFLADRLGSSMSRRRLEVLLAEQAITMEAQIEGVSEGILAMSSHGEVIGLNRRFLAMCGIGPGLLASDRRSIEVFQDHQDDDAFMEALHRLVEDRSDGQGCVEVDDVSYERRSVPLGDGSGGRVWYFQSAEGVDGPAA